MCIVHVSRRPFPRPAVVGSFCCEGIACRGWRVTTLQGLDAPGGTRP
jgi:hypothetical protein